ncbi:PREDICTED: uncharacterized protein LOC104820683 [Tarenaya hassleriana]|uniref:uncharacterized protein LOC104820683 n=1 Tax=Tarenaya hassleriana TaxID=28532 RepID=UPI00053C1A20|nr:PREDICTED: uncharacterized protein LOC104820683 [Tarenaya hassleriana]
MENSSERDDETVGEFRSERVKPPLHNFPLSSLKWGNQRFLRCVKADSSSSDDEHRLRRQASSPAKSGASPSRTINSGTEQPPPTIQHHHRWDRPAASGSSAGQVSKKVVPLDLKSRLREEEVEDEIEPMGKARRRRERQKETATEMAARPPWNLRTRKGAAASNNGGGGGMGPNRRLNDNQKPSGTIREDKPERPKFSVTLTKKEIEEDFMAMVGHLPPRRPKKRPGNVQRQLDSVFPGLWLKEVMPDSYSVSDSTERKKKSRQMNE